MFGLLILLVMAVAVTLTVMLYNRGLSVRAILVIAGVMMVLGFILMSNAVSTVGVEQFQAEGPTGPARWGIALIIGGLVSAVSLALLGIIRGLGRAQRNQDRANRR